MLLYNSKLIEIKALLMLIVLIKEIMSKHFNASIGKHKMIKLQQVYSPRITDSFRKRADIFVDWKINKYIRVRIVAWYTDIKQRIVAQNRFQHIMQNGKILLYCKTNSFAEVGKNDCITLC